MTKDNLTHFIMYMKYILKSLKNPLLKEAGRIYLIYGSTAGDFVQLFPVRVPG